MSGFHCDTRVLTCDEKSWRTAAKEKGEKGRLITG